MTKSANGLGKDDFPTVFLAAQTGHFAGDPDFRLALLATIVARNNAHMTLTLSDTDGEYCASSYKDIPVFSLQPLVGTRDKFPGIEGST